MIDLHGQSIVFHSLAFKWCGEWPSFESFFTTHYKTLCTYNWFQVHPQATLPQMNRPLMGDKTVMLQINWSFLQELVVLHSSRLFMLGEFRCILQVSAEVWTKNNLYRFIGSQTYLTFLDMLKWVWLLLNQHRLFFVHLHTDSKHAPKTYQAWQIMYAEKPTSNQNSGLIKGLLLIYVSCVSLLHLYFLCPHFKKPRLKERERWIPHIQKKSYESTEKGQACKQNVIHVKINMTPSLSFAVKQSKTLH